MNFTRVLGLGLILLVGYFNVASFDTVVAQDFDIFGEPDEPAIDASSGSVVEEIPAVEPLNNKQASDLDRESGTVDQNQNSNPQLNSLFCDQWVRVNERGVLLGSVVSLIGEDSQPVPGVRVSLAQQGRVVAFMPTRKDGSFAFNGVKPGSYSVVVESNNHFATMGIAVLSNELGKHLPNDFEIRAISPKSLGMIEMLQRDVVPSFSSTNVDFALKDPLAKQRRFSASRSIATEKDGSIRGTISKMGMGAENASVVGMKACLLKNGNAIQTVSLSKDGSFRFPDVKTGVYGLFVAGPAGVAAVAFYATNDSKVAAVSSTDSSHLVAFVAQGEGGSGLNVELADGNDVTGSRQSQPEDSDPDESPPDEIPLTDPSIGTGTGTGGGGTPMSGGGGGSSGGGGGGGLAGLEGLAGLGLLAGGLAAAGNNSDNSTLNNQPPLVSPIVP